MGKPGTELFSEYLIFYNFVSNGDEDPVVSKHQTTMKNKLIGFIGILVIIGLAIFFIWRGKRAGLSEEGPWYHRADTASVALVENFWNKELHYCNYDSAGDTTFHYWPQAHALDVFTDWYLRSKDSRVLELYDQWYEGVPAANEGGFWNPYYDDMEWNGIAALRAYKATGQERFLEAAQQLWEFILPGWNEQAEGGITWKKGLEWSKNACSNGPGAILAARLYQELKRPEDLDWARRIYAWEKEVLFDNGAISMPSWRPITRWSTSRWKAIFFSRKGPGTVESSRASSCVTSRSSSSRGTLMPIPAGATSPSLPITPRRCGPPALRRTGASARTGAPAPAPRRP